MRYRGIQLLALLVLAACGTADSPTLAAPETPPAREIYHWSNGGNEGFYFFDGGAPAGATSNPFDPDVSPTVRICRISGGSCGPTLATFTRTSGSYGRQVTVDAADEAYEVSWPTGSTGAAPGQVFRISVSVGARELGYLDVVMITSWVQWFTTDRSEYLPWIAGYALPIAFRIEQGVPGAIVLSTSSIALNVGEGVPVTATLLGLRGQPLDGPVYWEMEPTSSPGAAVLDSGLVAAQNPGTATLWAWNADIEVQVPVTVTDTRRAWSTAATPDDQGNRGIWGSSPVNVYAANHTGLLRNGGAGWTHVDALRWRSLHDVWGASAANVWAVGDKGEIARFDGAAWALHRFDGDSVSPRPLGDFGVPARAYTLRGVWGSAANDVFAVGDSGVVLHFDGAAWTRMSTGTTAQLNDVWGSGPNNVYAATAGGRLLRYDGTAWSAVPGVQAPGMLRAVWGTSASNVYAVGDGGIVFRYDGSGWTRIRLATRAALYAVGGTGAGNVYVGGEAGALYRFSGTAWTAEKAQNGASRVHGIWASGTNVFAAGAGGLVAKR